LDTVLVDTRTRAFLDAEAQLDRYRRVINSVEAQEV
jgi:hypothetical protein